MHWSAVLVLAAADRLEECRRQLESLPGVEVHQVHPPSGRLIAILESATQAGQEERLSRIQELPVVRLAALVEHRTKVPAAGAPTEGADCEEPPATDPT